MISSVPTAHRLFELGQAQSGVMEKLVPIPEIRVWDPFIRICHWLLAVAVIWDWLSEDPLWLHAWLGYMAAALVILRVLWGSVGPSHARFVSFITGPRTIFDYLAGLVRFSSKRYIGHSPAGGAMIVALLLMIAATAGTGMATLAADEGQGPLSSVIPKVERSDSNHDEKTGAASDQGCA